MSGTDCALSHLETDWRVTSSCCASSSCDQPARFRSCVIFSAKIIVKPPGFGDAFRVRRDGSIIAILPVARNQRGAAMCQPAVAFGFLY